MIFTRILVVCQAWSPVWERCSWVTRLFCKPGCLTYTLVHNLPAALSAMNERANVKWWQYSLVLINWTPDWPVEKLQELFTLADQATIMIFGLPDELRQSIECEHAVITTSGQNPYSTLDWLDRL